MHVWWKVRLSKVCSWKDSHRQLYPNNKEEFSHYYSQGATRIDRQYHWGDVSVTRSEYIPVAFSDHFGLIIEAKVPYNLCQQIRKDGMFKVRNDVACDPDFKESVAANIIVWRRMLNNGLDIIKWWEIVVKPGIRMIALRRAREIRSELRNKLNMLYIKQAYLVRKLKLNINNDNLTALKHTQLLICNLFDQQSNRARFRGGPRGHVPRAPTFRGPPQNWLWS